MTSFFDDKVTLTAEQLRRKRQDIGMIFQHFNLMSQKTAEENVAFALKHSGLSKEEKKAKVAKLLDLVGLADRAENYPSQLSGGQKQRVAIARAWQMIQKSWFQMSQPLLLTLKQPSKFWPCCKIWTKN